MPSTTRPPAGALPAAESAAFDALRDTLAQPLVALADRLDALVRRERGEGTPLMDKLARKTTSARMNFPLGAAAPAAAPDEPPTVSRINSTAVLLGPERTLLTKIARNATPLSAHETRKLTRLEAPILTAMRNLLTVLAAAAPHHFHPDITSLTAAAGDPLPDRDGTLRPTLSVKFHELPLASHAALPATVADTLARRVSRLTDATAAAPSLPWRQFRIRGEILHAPDGRRAMELHLAIADPETLIHLSDPAITDDTRRRLLSMLPEISEIRDSGVFFSTFCAGP